MTPTEEYSLKYVYSSKDQIKAPFYGVSFNKFDNSGDSNFAIVGGSTIIVVSIDGRKSSEPNLYQYEQDIVPLKDPENFYCCAWIYDQDTDSQWIAAGGSTGIIKILDLIPSSVKCMNKKLIGHGDEINEIQNHPRDTNLLFSGSKDFSIRLWDLKTCQPIVIFGGECGHREPDIHISGNFLASAGMDHAIKIWTLCTPIIQNAIDVSKNSKPQRYSGQCCTTGDYIITPLFVHFPIFSSIDIHNNYVDCVRWYGDYILSRCAATTTIIMWKPKIKLSPVEDKSTITSVVVGGPSKPSTSYDIHCELDFENCDIWFLRFTLSPDQEQLVIGNQTGDIFLWDMNQISNVIANYTKKKIFKICGKKTAKGKKKKGKDVANSDLLECIKYNNVTNFTRMDLIQFASDELITIEPFFNSRKFTISGKEFGPFNPPKKAQVPLWAALMLKEKKVCKIIQPDWLTVENLDIRSKEEKPESAFADLPYWYNEISSILLKKAEDDLENPNQIRYLLQGLKEKREMKIRQGLLGLDPSIRQTIGER
ncbi:15848_t:CDS:10 [Entrophospora sp. SA101]|nr:15848_t:CDS:10 [Entrophospora sp. SA101]CAJ0912390.1 15468_t:CDS:10 [Entrophospora sp. SA101]